MVTNALTSDSTGLLLPHLVEALLGPRHQKHRIAEIHYEKFGVAAFDVANQNILAQYASGRNTILSVVLGHGK
jgi:actin-related protein